MLRAFRAGPVVRRHGRAVVVSRGDQPERQYRAVLRADERRAAIYAERRRGSPARSPTVRGAVQAWVRAFGPDADHRGLTITGARPLARRCSTRSSRPPRASTAVPGPAARLASRPPDPGRRLSKSADFESVRLRALRVRLLPRACLTGEPRCAAWRIRRTSRRSVDDPAHRAASRHRRRPGVSIGHAGRRGAVADASRARRKAVDGSETPGRRGDTGKSCPCGIPGVHTQGQSGLTIGADLSGTRARRSIVDESGRTTAR